jgi:hypothetical protein
MGRNGPRAIRVALPSNSQPISFARRVLERLTRRFALIPIAPVRVAAYRSLGHIDGIGTVSLLRHWPRRTGALHTVMSAAPSTFLPCPALRAEVELTAERERHIATRHPDLLPAYRARLGEVLADPDIIRRSARSATAHLFSRWYSDMRHGQHIVVIVEGKGSLRRYWVVTAYAARRRAAGEIEWQRS